MTDFPKFIRRLAAAVDAGFNVSADEALDFDVWNANEILAGPTTGAAAKPTKRAMVQADVATHGSAQHDSTATLKYAWSWSTSTADLSTSATQYLPPNTNSILADGTLARVPIPHAGTIKNLYVNLLTVPGGTGSRTFTVAKNGGSQSLAVTFGAAENGVKSDTSNSFTVVAGDTLMVVSTLANSPAASRAQWSFEVDP